MCLPVYRLEADPASPSEIGPPGTAPAQVLALPRRPAVDLAAVGGTLKGLAAVVLPPLVTLGVILAFWQGLTGDSMAVLPSPASIWRDSRELILNPFFDRGGVDKGLFWHALTSLSRVAIGFRPAGFSVSAEASMSPK